MVSSPVLPWIPRTVVLQEPIHSAFHSGRYGYLQDYEQSSTPREIMCFVTFVCHVPLLRYSTVPQVREASDGQMEGTLVLLYVQAGALNGALRKRRSGVPLPALLDKHHYQQFFCQ